jgi:hypothetical protein
MSDASEFLQWQADSQNYLTDHCPESLAMTDAEILDWLNEYLVRIDWNRASSERIEEFVIHSDYAIARGRTIREATKLAAAKYKEANT